MTALLALYVTAKLWMADRLAQDDGQTSMEWLGIGVVVVAIAVALAGFGGEMAGTARDAFNTLVARVLGG